MKLLLILLSSLLSMTLATEILDLAVRTAIQRLNRERLALCVTLVGFESTLVGFKLEMPGVNQDHSQGKMNQFCSHFIVNVYGLSAFNATSDRFTSILNGQTSMVAVMDSETFSKVRLGDPVVT